MKKVQVLLSSYNGEKFIKEQIDSILQQEKVNVSLLIRDDGSTDSTREIVGEYAYKYKNVHFYKGNNIGTQKSYFDLLSHADLKNDYFAFSDQDDVWLPHKLSHGIELLDSENLNNSPLLYASDVFPVTADLKVCNRKIKKKVPSFGNALLENICIGCTEIFNKNLLELVLKNELPYNIWHDWWLYLIAAYFGKVIYDQRAGILYRQHERNQVGMSVNHIDKWLSRIRRQKELYGKISYQASEFKRVISQKQLLEKKSYEKELKLILEYRSSKADCWKLIRYTKICRQSKVDDLFYRILFLIQFL